jgi:DNA-binding NtrC family response regulator
MSKKILVVEDDLACEAVLRRTIHTLAPDADIDWEESAEQAVAALERDRVEGRSYDLIIADIFLSGTETGLDLLKVCSERFPDTPVLITSSLPMDRFFQTVGTQTIAPPFLPKPFYIAECRQVIEGLLKYARH